MVTKIRSHLTYSNVMATLAVFMVLGGGAYAATKLPKNSVTSVQVKDRSLLSKDFKTGQLPKGAKGDAGAAGATGATGAAGAKGEKGDKGDPGPATGAAGGALSGSYPNPGLADNAVTSSKLAAGAVGTGQLGKAPFGYSDTAQTTSVAGTGTFAQLTVPTVEASDRVSFNTNTITVTEAGLYYVSGFFRWDSTNQTGFRQVIVQRTNTGPSGTSQNIVNDVVSNGHVAQYQVQPFSGVVKLLPGDDLIAQAGQNSASALDVNFNVSVVRISGVDG